MKDELVQKIIAWATIALIGLVLEMRLRVGEQAKELDAIRVSLVHTTKLAEDSWHETLQRKDVIDWVREFRQANGWTGDARNYVLRKGEK